MMKKLNCLVLMAILGCGLYTFGQQENEVIKETVRVVNVEVPVRVYYQGKPVDTLTRNDFKLTEGGKSQAIHGFILKRKKIKVQDLELTAEQQKIKAPRYFVLVFRITHYNDYIKDGLDYLFENILRDSDQLLAFANDRSAFFKSLQDKTAVKTDLDRMLSDASLEARNRMLLYLKNIENLINKHKFEMSLRQTGSRGGIMSLHWTIEEYLRKFLEVWKIYKKDHLIPDINKYYNFARFLKDIDLEKWVLNFYQFEVFPDIIISSESMRRIRQLVGEWQTSENQELTSASRIVTRHLNDIEKELSIAKDFPSEEVAKIFHNVDTTFHSIFMKTSISTLLEDMEYREIATDLENSLRAITDRTGGELVVSNKLDTALDRISEVEDVYYVLTYAPKNPDQVGKIKVKIKEGKYKLVYSPNLRTGYLSQFLEDKQIEEKNPIISDLKFAKGKIMFKISEFTWKEKEGGMLSIRIRLKDPQGKPTFDQQKALKASQKKINIALNISGIDKGEYDVVVDVTDMYTKMSGSQLLKIKINK